MAIGKNKNIWWHLTTYKQYQAKKVWRGWDLISKSWWGDFDYIFHDSIGKYWNCYFKCARTGHGHLKDVSCPNMPTEWYCFDCETLVSMQKYDCGRK